MLAFGAFDLNPTNGTPDIPTVDPPYPQPDYLSVEPYSAERSEDDDFQNPNPRFTERPNKPLQLAIDILSPDSFIHWNVTTEPIGGEEGIVTNIPFEQELAEVTEYFADYWLLSTDSGRNFDYLAYTQTMLMDMIINGRPYTFPHVTCNVVTRK